LEKETDEKLFNIYNNVIKEIKNGKQVNFFPFVQIDTSKTLSYKKEYHDVQIYSEEENESELFRELISFENINGKNYRIIIRSSLIEKEDIFNSIITIELFTFVIFIIILFFINKTISQKIFRDFYETLKKIEEFTLRSEMPLDLKNSDIDEFEKLNKAISLLSEKAIGEYRSLKEFSEEMNHEFQTPSAVIKSKLELLIQSNDLSEKNLSILNIALKNLNKLEKINKSILLLNKLDHKNLFDSIKINLSKEIKKAIDDYSDFISAKNLHFDFNEEKNIFVSANHSLITILLSNLISNAIKHNIENGTITIVLKNQELIISNTRKISTTEPEKFFERFYREDKSTDSVGLGLSIAKKICDMYGFRISNKFSDNHYIVVVKFDN